MKFVITFGIGSPFKKQYAILKAEDETKARIFARNVWGMAWAGIYNEDNWVNEYDYTLMGEYDVPSDLVYTDTDANWGIV